ncbi:ribokinase family sugar kinase [Streptococcus pneumoniae]|nr:ribokinase family sugar kinase [Streptococcus pneumoniae]VKI72984.1 ribokinase family sugar kinase [Streptococcus pneumoniae]VKJ36311.1 ribokinase family sugar kinase [Streptococcus pneumoniae]VKS85130.1 ribokinase family sugar kinase [Streptococcus pneumoniae]VLR25938.1 ribokinase family sugar kinase [Streptococcus pneumoniae]
MECQFGGSELNVLASLAQLGHSVELVTALPRNEVGKMAEHFLFARQIGQKYLIRKEGRLGLYYYQKGFSLRPSQVTYDRDYSAFSLSREEDYDLEGIFEDVDWFHVSGITVALNPAIRQLAFRLMEMAKEQGIKVSFDLNYRESLWSSFEEAREKLSPFVGLADICFGLEPIQLLNESGKDMKDELGLKRSYENREILLSVVKALAETYSLQSIAFTQREMTYNNEYLLKAYLYQDGVLYETEKESIQVLDRVGTGDAFTAGIILGYLQEKSPQEVVDLGMASFQFKHTIEGDVNVISQSDIDLLLKKGSREIKR